MDVLSNEWPLEKKYIIIINNVSVAYSTLLFDIIRQ